MGDMVEGPEHGQGKFLGCFGWGELALGSPWLRGTGDTRCSSVVGLYQAAG